MTIDECLAMANSQSFRNRVKFSMFKKAISVRKDPGATQTAKDAARLVIDEKLDAGKIAFAIVTEASIYGAADEAAVTDAMIDTAVVSVFPAFV
jgi:hypothetical protein